MTDSTKYIDPFSHPDTPPYDNGFSTTDKPHSSSVGKEHDFRSPAWGWAINFSLMKELEPGKFQVLGHGCGIRKGDYVRICTKQKPVIGRKYLVGEITYYKDPKDMFKIVLIQNSFTKDNEK